MDAKALGEALTHILEGYDIPAIEGMLKVRQDRAAHMLDAAPYSMLQNLAHAVLWQRLWLNKLKGGKKHAGPEEWKNDWRLPDPNEWDALRREFVDGLRQAREIASREPFVHQCDSDEEAVDALCRILVHGSYHIGQMNMLKRMLRSGESE